MTYLECKRILDNIRRRDEMIFRMAISHLIDVGIRHLDEKSVEETCNDILQKDDSKAFITNEFLCNIVKTAGEIAKIDHILLLVYIQREVTFGIYEGRENEDDIV